MVGAVWVVAGWGGRGIRGGWRVCNGWGGQGGRGGRGGWGSRALFVFQSDEPLQNVNSFLTSVFNTVFMLFHMVPFFL